ncbi:MAG: protein kinase, partial [Planctomycetota bacterium]|nr:protein kinase [Planctomycetota bacterium]
MLEEGLLRAAPRVDYNGHVCPSLGGIPLLRKLGQGGMGAVYSGIHPRLQVEVAVKVLPYQLQEKDPLLVERFFREAQISAAVRSPHLVNVMDVNEEHGVFYLVMEFVHGQSAKEYLESAMKSGMQGVPERDALHICIAAAEGLNDAHNQGVIHRDVKPDNVMIPYRPHTQELDLTAAKLMDLGLARADAGVIHNAALTQTKQAMGTPGFMAPEQIMDARSAGPPADVFAMGATIYSLLAGQAPFKKKNSMQTLMATLQAPHEPITKVRPDVSAELAAVIDKCLAKTKDQRYANGGELLHEFRRCLRQLPKKEGAAPSDGIKTLAPAAAATSPVSPTAPKPVSAPGAQPPAAPKPKPVSAPAAQAPAAPGLKPVSPPSAPAPAAPRKKPGLVLLAGLGAAAVLLVAVAIHFLRSPAPPPVDLVSTYQESLENARRGAAKLDAPEALRLLQSARDMRLKFGIRDAAFVERENAIEALIGAMGLLEKNASLDDVEAQIKAAQKVLLYDPDADVKKDAMTRICLDVVQRRLKEAEKSLATGDIAAAQKSVKAGLGIIPGHPQLLSVRGSLMEKGLAAAEAGLAKFAFDDAKKCLDALSAIDPADKRVAALREKLDLERDKRDKFEFAVKDAKTKLAQGGGDLSLLEKRLQEAHKSYPGDPALVPLRQELARRRLNLAEKHLEKEELDEARLNIESAEALSPDEARIAQLKERLKTTRQRREKFSALVAEAKADLGTDVSLSDIEKKIAEAESLYARDPQIADLRDLVKKKREKLDIAAELKKQKEFDAALQQHETALKAGNFDEAETHLAAAEKIKPGDPLIPQKRERLAQKKEEARRLADEQARRNKFMAGLKQVDELLKAGQLDDAVKRIAEAEKEYPD